MVATSQSLAAQAGLSILQKGGNAIDAAVATAAALTVVEPTSNGIGGDAFAIVWFKGEMYGINGSGPAPQRISSEEVAGRGHKEMPKFGWIPVTVPGAPRVWASLVGRFGKLSLAEVLEPAIRYGEEGYAISPVLGYYWQRAHEIYKDQLVGDEFKEWFRVFAPQGRAPKIGEVWTSPVHAETLRAIGQSDASDFYTGLLAQKIDKFSQDTGGFLRAEDLAAFDVEWVDPVSSTYKGYQIWELPPNGQGIVALIALNIYKELVSLNQVDDYHHQIEAMKQAFAQTKERIADPRFSLNDVERWLSSAFAKNISQRIGDLASVPTYERREDGGTVYLATADRDGNMVSFIQSNYMGFGSGLVVPGTGIALQNRGHGFSLEKDHPNCLAPAKRSYHTIIPGFLTRNSMPVGPFGVMGGFMQPQGHMQVMLNCIDHNHNPQAALDAPRWQWIANDVVEFESGIPLHLVRALARKGHKVKIASEAGGFGRGQIIFVNEHGVYCGGTDPRTDGAVSAW